MPPMRLLPALSRLAALASVFGLLGQSVLPAAHSWSVGAEEAAYHAAVHAAAPRAGLCDDHDRGHHHHSGADCRLCPLYASARLAPLAGLRPAGGPAPLASHRGAPSALRPSADLAAAPVRGPPGPAA